MFLLHFVVVAVPLSLPILHPSIHIIIIFSKNVWLVPALPSFDLVDGYCIFKRSMTYVIAGSSALSILDEYCSLNTHIFEMQYLHHKASTGKAESWQVPEKAYKHSRSQLAGACWDEVPIPEIDFQLKLHISIARVEVFFHFFVVQSGKCASYPILYHLPLDWAGLGLVRLG